MNIDSIGPPADCDKIPLESLAGDSRLTREQKLAEVTRQFEAILLREILRHTRETVFPSEFDDHSTAAGIYHDLVTDQLADSISRSGTLGLARTLERQLSRQLQASDPAAAAGRDAVPGSAGHTGLNPPPPPPVSVPPTERSTKSH
jgi:Rod binding domain-containing protein